MRLLGMVLLGAVAAYGEWPRFRGPNGSGVETGAGYPAEFSPTKNVVWKAAVPYGQSSPIVVKGKVFLTASEGDQLLTICLDAGSGKELWRRGVKRERAAKLFRANDPASPTPTADESGVYAFFADFGLVSYTLDGKERWRHPLGPFRNFYGMASSPVVVGELVVMLCDQQSGSFLVALDRQTGRRKWRTERPGTTIGWATPMVFRSGEGEELIVLGTTSVDSYYVATGERKWWMPVRSAGGLGTPVAAGDTVLVTTAGSEEPMLPSFESMLAKYDKDKDGKLSFEEFRGDPDFGEHFGWLDANDDKLIDEKEWDAANHLGTGDYGVVAVRPGKAQGELKETVVRWRMKKSLPYIPAPLVYEDVFYMVRTGGILTALDAATGKVLKQGRGAAGEYYASPVAADGKVFLASEEGKMTVVKAGREWEVLAVNDLSDEIHATPALSGGRIYVRTRGTVFCFGSGRLE